MVTSILPIKLFACTFPKLSPDKFASKSKKSLIAPSIVYRRYYSDSDTCECQHIYHSLTVQNMSQTLSSTIERPIGPAEHTGMVGICPKQLLRK